MRASLTRAALSWITQEKSSSFHPAAHGVEIRTADHDVPGSLSGAFRAGDRVLLISGNEFGRRLAQHAAVIDAAKTAGVTLLAYTSILGGPATRFVVAEDHHATEKAIEASGLPYTFLRNGWYTENYTGQLPGVLATGTVIGTRPRQPDRHRDARGLRRGRRRCPRRCGP
jgi:NAD(P)H dehydrogenase (quinone)